MALGLGTEVCVLTQCVRCHTIEGGVQLALGFGHRRVVGDVACGHQLHNLVHVVNQRVTEDFLGRVVSVVEALGHLGKGCVCTFPHIAHRSLQLFVIELLVLFLHDSQCLVANVQSPVTSVRHRHGHKAEAELLGQALTCGVLVGVEQVAQLELGVLNLPVVRVEEHVDDALKLNL